MSTLARLNCPSCGSPIEIVDDSPTIKCPYCGSIVAVPAELRGQRAASEAAGSNASAGNILFEDDFSGPAGGWETGRDYGVTADYNGGGYRLRVTDDEGDREEVSGGQYKDVSVEVDATRVRGPSDGAFGIVCRNSDAGTFSFGISADGYYGIYKAQYGEDEEDDDEWTLAESKRGDAIKRGDNVTNHIRADCVGAKLTLYVNGQKMLEVEDPDYDPEYDEAGDVGVFAAAGDSGKRGLEVIFKNFVVGSAAA
ncbi:MAG: hypothetical protein HY260_04920 [Chloroflexi bacterium]|nr:hypothetical protein [Chloroflexota bacterium]